jgi:hypothetical protein
LPSISDDAAIISAIGVILGTVFIVIQLRHMEMHRNLDISMKLFEWADRERIPIQKLREIQGSGSEQL